VGFGNADTAHDTCIFYPAFTVEFKEVYWTLDVVTDAVFFLEIWVQFHTAVWKLNPGVVQCWELCDDPRTVRWLYLKGEFKLDAVGQIPWHYVNCFASSSERWLRALRLLRLFKLFRLHSLNRRITNLFRERGKTNMSLIELLFKLFLGGHWMSCLWFWLGFGSHGDPASHGWVAVHGMVDSNGHLIDSFFFAWITSFYWSVTTMTTIGYGDISAGTSWERTIACIAMCMGAGLFAWGTGKITQVLTWSSHCQERFTNLEEELNEFMDCRGISMGLRLQVKNYFQLKFPSERIFDEPAIMASLPRELRYKLMMKLYADMMQMAPLFMACGEDTKREICYRMRSTHCTEGITVTTEGEVATNLYIVQLGSVRITRKGEELAILERSEMFGENAIFSWSCDGKRTRTAVALTWCDLCTLSVEDVEHLFEKYNSFYFSVRRIVAAHSACLRSAIDDGHPLSTADIYMIGWRVCAERIMAQNESFRALSKQKKDVIAFEKELNECQHLGNAGAAANSSVQKVPHHLLHTRFRVLVLSLQTSLQPGDFSNGQIVSIELSCKSMPGVTTSEVHATSQDTSLFLKDGHVSFSASIDMDIYHEYNRWDVLGDVHVSIIDKGINLLRAEKISTGPCHVPDL